MTPQELRAAAAGWREIHERLHGPLDVQTAETVNEVIAFLVSCAQVPVICVKHLNLRCFDKNCIPDAYDDCPSCECDSAKYTEAMRDAD